MKKCGTCKYITWSCPGTMCINENHPNFDKDSDYPNVVYLENMACSLYEEQNMEFVINLLSSRQGINAYGWYQGGCYIYQGEYYPKHSRDSLNSYVKRYTTEKRAIRAAQSVVDKCGYVAGYEVYKLVAGVPVLVSREV